MMNVSVSLEAIEIPRVLRSLTLTLELLQEEVRAKGHDPDFFGPIPLYKERIRKFRALTKCDN